MVRKVSIPLLIGLLGLALAGVAIAKDAVGTPGNDTLRGSDGPDQLYGEGGDDTLEALRGDDYVEAGPGADLVFGGGGVDLLLGGTSNDSIRGDGGEDTVYAGHGNDRVWGGPAGDRLLGQAGHDRLEGGSGNDYLTASAQSLVSGGDNDDRIFIHPEGGSVARLLAAGYEVRGGLGNDSIDARDGRTSSVDCGAGSDRAYVDPRDRTRGCERRIQGARR